ncbi:MAG: helix-turn-helix domain protein [Bacillales bacterium]|nr:helix-turn-helix domain protein [Bacillales bacterium]
MDRFLLGKEIKRRRVELKLTQKQLAFGICKQSIISKVENGDFFPSFELLIRRYEEAFKISDREIQTNENLIGEHKEFFVSTRAVTAYYTNTLSFNESISFLKQCFIENNDYINQDQKLINRNFIAVLYAENGYSEKALEEFEGILIEFENKSFNHFYLRVLFNYANLLHNCALFEKTLFVIKEAIEVCKKVENVNMFGKFYFLKGECLIDLGYNKEDITPCFEKALFYFDMIHNDDYIKILWDRYSNYL